MLKAKSVSVPHMRTTTQGTFVRAVAGVELSLADQAKPTLYFETVSQQHQEPCHESITQMYRTGFH